MTNAMTITSMWEIIKETSKRITEEREYDGFLLLAKEILGVDKEYIKDVLDGKRISIEVQTEWKNLTEEERIIAKNQYISIRANEDDISEDKAREIYDTTDEAMECHSYFIECFAGNETNVYINI